MNQSGQKFEPNTLKVMKELQRQIVNYNNQYITKKHTVMGTTFKVRILFASAFYLLYFDFQNAIKDCLGPVYFSDKLIKKILISKILCWLPKLVG
jgi:hypothetical protein